MRGGFADRFLETLLPVAFAVQVLYRGLNMKPVINLEETIGKCVGVRKVPADSFRYGMQLQKAGGQLSRRFGTLQHPRGVFKFHSHEEADAWMMKYLTTRKEG